jgi:hypothetical protein
MLAHTGGGRFPVRGLGCSLDHPPKRAPGLGREKLGPSVQAVLDGGRVPVVARDKVLLVHLPHHAGANG